MPKKTRTNSSLASSRSDGSRSSSTPSSPNRPMYGVHWVAANLVGMVKEVAYSEDEAVKDELHEPNRREDSADFNADPFVSAAPVPNMEGDADLELVR